MQRFTRCAAIQSKPKFDAVEFDLVTVIMAMLINRQLIFIAKKRKIFGVLINRFGRAVAANVMINAKHQIGFLHHGVKIV
jgi:hypothetical protein